VLVILDGASEPLGDGPTSLERAVTPALDALCAAGVLTRVRTVAPWLEAGSEHAIPALLGWVPPAPVDRGAVEAAARGIELPAGGRAWRVDVREARGGGRADAGAVREALVETLRLGDGGAVRDVVGEALRSGDAGAAHELPRRGSAPSRFTVHMLGGHRLLVVGPAPLPSLPSCDGVTLHAWPEGVVPPRSLSDGTVVVAAPGAAAGIGRLMGARVLTPAGATGRLGSDLAAKARAAIDALAGGAASVVVHVGAPDEAAHELDAAAKVAAIEAADRELIAPLTVAVRAAGGTLRVCPDHGCDPSDGRHDPAPVPVVTWSAQSAPSFAQDAPRFAAGAPSFAQSVPRSAEDAPSFAQRAPSPIARRMTERAVAQLPVVELAQTGQDERERATGQDERERATGQDERERATHLARERAAA
jgi:2,3-bisphosphoglycerate-independent phosphoglycerate mutase